MMTRLTYGLAGLAGVVLSFFAALSMIDWFSGGASPTTPVLVASPPLPPASHTSTVIAPVTIALTAIRDAVERNTPRNFSGKADNPAPQLISNADIAWTVARGAAVAAGGQDTISLSIPLNGTVHATGSLSQQAIGGLLGSLLGGDAAKRIGAINIKSLNADAEIKGSAAVSSHPALTPNWQIEPNLTAQVTLADTNLSASGVKVGLSDQLKPVIDKMVNEQVAAAQARMRDDPAFEQAARREWTKMCRSIPLPAAAAGLPDLWLEIRPTKAVAAQPRVDAANIVLMLGIEALTSVATAQTKPDCPFPATLEIVPPRDGGRLSIGVPIDLPFSEVDKIINTQLKGRTFPEGGDGAVAITVQKASVAASGDRLLISLQVTGKESRSFLGLRGDAVVHLWGKPVLDQAQQTLKLADIEIAIESEAAFGLLGAAARAAMPYIQSELAERATIDLKPFATEAKAKISAGIAELRKDDNGVKVDATITAMRLAEIAFDSKTFRIIAEAEGAIGVAVTQLPGL